MSVSRLVVFSIDGQQFGLAVEAVDRVVPIVAVAPLPQAPDIALGVINLHGSIVPVLDVRRRLGAAARPPRPEDRLILARAGGRTVALPVDEVAGIRDIPDSALTSPSAVLPGIGQVAGIAALPDGLIYVHDLERFLSLDETRLLNEALEEAAHP